MDLSLSRRRALRAASTDAERVLWRQLRGRRFLRYKFRRQFPCGPYILDFYCSRRHLAIELDGGQHYLPAAQAYDRRRSAYLRAQGITVLRFPTDVVFRAREALLQVIGAALAANKWGPSPFPLPAARGEGKRAGGSGRHLRP